MASVRAVRFCTDSIYHVFNRGVERRNIFLSVRDRERFVQLLEYYRFATVPKSFSHYLSLLVEERNIYHEKLQVLPHNIDVLAYCLMPNHFHLLVRQREERGVVESMSNIANGYAKYFNTKQKRVGPLFQGPFKAVRIESDEQLIHVSRYIHINPVVSGIVRETELYMYPWSSLPAYIHDDSKRWIETGTVLAHFRSSLAYRTFIDDQISYKMKLDTIKHILLEEV